MPELRSDDGTRIAYIKVGSGAGLILVPGALAVATDFTVLATALGRYFTVYTIERRGRGGSGPQGSSYAIEKECQDILALQKITDAKYIFGHSFGGFAVLEAARNSKAIKKVAVYEPGVSIEGSINTDWVTRCQREITAKKYHAAFVTFVRGTNPQSRKAPRLILSLILKIVIKKAERQQKHQLLSAAIKEHQEEARLNDTFAHYNEIHADVLLMRGEKGVMTSEAMAMLLSVMPSAQSASFANADHLAPEQAPQLIAEKLVQFFNQSEGQK